MEQQNNPDKSTFRVKLLGEYHNIVIDWNDEHKKQHLFEQFATITGIPIEYTGGIHFCIPRAGFAVAHYCRVFNDINLPPFYITSDGNMDKDIINGSISRGDDSFLLDYALKFWHKSSHSIITYQLTLESAVPEGLCGYVFCRYKHTKIFQKKLKEIINNHELNAKISSHLDALEGAEVDIERFESYHQNNILRQLNVLQYFDSTCMCNCWNWRNSAEYIRIRRNRNLYLRTSG